MPRHYHQTTPMQPAALAAASRNAISQDDVVLGIFATQKRPLSPSEVLALYPGKILLTSVRRAMSNLTNAGALVKLDSLADGPHGKPEHRWQLPAGQGELFQGRVG